MADERVLSRVEPNRRGFLQRVLGGAAFAAPVLATFSLGALTSRAARAQSPNGCLGANDGPCPTPEPTSAILVATVAVGLGIAAHRSAQHKEHESSGPEADE